MCPTKPSVGCLAPAVLFSGCTWALGWCTGHRVRGVHSQLRAQTYRQACKKCWKSTSDYILASRSTPQLFLRVYHTWHHSFLLNNFVGISWLWDEGDSLIYLCVPRSNVSLSLITFIRAFQITLRIYRLYQQCKYSGFMYLVKKKTSNTGL